MCEVCTVLPGKSHPRHRGPSILWVRGGVWDRVGRARIRFKRGVSFVECLSCVRILGTPMVSFDTYYLKRSYFCASNFRAFFLG